MIKMKINAKIRINESKSSNMAFERLAAVPQVN